MKTTAVLFALATTAVASVSADCSTPEWGQCSGGDTVSCCPSGFYCQPWTPNYFQCQQKPAKCQRQYTNIDFVGNDLMAIYGIQPGDCCTRCTQTKGCTAYTFVNYRPGKTACYLKRIAGKQMQQIGAVSGIVANSDDDENRSGSGSSTPPPPPPPPSPVNGCKTNPYGRCGDQTKAFCCPDGQYCQPWNPGYYQCMQTPSKCPKQLTDVEFHGNDIGKAHAGTGDECCDACARKSNCKAYTFINFSNDGPQCFLKSSAGNGKGKKKIGAVSAIRR